MKNINKNTLNPLYFNCDFLEFSIENFKKLPFSKKYNFTFNLDVDNSSQGFVEIKEIGKILSYRKVDFKNYAGGLIFSISIDNVSYDIFYFKKGKTNKANIKTSDTVGFYSTFFVLEAMGHLDFYIIDFYNDFFNLETNQLKRLDICLDLNNSIEEINNTLFKGVSFYSTLGKDEKNPLFSQTYYIKNPLSSKNRFYIFRIYDKILDSFIKGKNFIFSYLKDYDDVRRVEVELRSEACKMIFYTVQEILENKNNVLENIFKNYLIKKGNVNKDFIFDNLRLFKNLGNYSFKKFENKKFNLEDHYLKNKQIPKRYIAQGHGYLKKLFEVGGFDLIYDLFYKVYIENEKKSIEKSQYGYLFFEKLLNYFLENNFNKNEILRIFGHYKKNAKYPKIKLNKKIGK